MPAPNESIDTVVTDIYPGIAPEKFGRIHEGKVVLVTGGGTGLGLEAAKAFAQTGAKVFITGRRAAPLETAKAEIEALGGEAAFAVMDVVDTKSVDAGVQALIERFGKLDIVIANAGKAIEPGQKLAESDADEWWSVVEASLKGSFLTAHATIPHLVKSKGYIILLGSALGQVRLPGGSSYDIAKHSLNRLAEYIALDYGSAGVKSFVVHPGAVATDLSAGLAAWMPNGAKVFSQSPKLSAWTYVRLTSGTEDWLSGRYIYAPGSLDELAKLKEKIIEQDALKNRLALPI